MYNYCHQSTLNPEPLTLSYDLDFQSQAYIKTYKNARSKVSRFKRPSGNKRTDGRTDRLTPPIALASRLAIAQSVIKMDAAAVKLQRQWNVFVVVPVISLPDDVLFFLILITLIVRLTAHVACSEFTQPVTATSSPPSASATWLFLSKHLKQLKLIHRLR